MSDRLGNNFVGIAPPEYIRDVLCAQASDPTRPPREPRSARRFWGRSGCCSRRNLRNEELCRNPGSRSSDAPRAMLARATLWLVFA
jgi:hypothetical protein